MVNTKKNKSNRNRNKSKNKSKSKKRILNNKKRKVKTIKKRQRKKQTGSGPFAFLGTTTTGKSQSKVLTQDINELEKIYTGINLSNNWSPKNKKDCHNNLIALANLNNKSSMQDYLEIKERIHKCLPKEDVSRVLPYILAAVGENEPEND